MSIRFIPSFFVLLIFKTVVFSQSFYYNDVNNNVGVIDLSNTCVNSEIFSFDDTFGDIAFSPDGRIFGVRGLCCMARSPANIFLWF